MKCREIGERLIDVAAGLPPDSQVEAHLRTCASCAAQLAELQQTMSLLDEWKAPEPSPYFDVRLQARLREEAAQSRGWLQWFRRPVLATTMAALLVAAAGLYTTANRNIARPMQVQSAAVQDLQDLDKNQEILADFDLLDDLGSEQTPPSENF